MASITRYCIVAMLLIVIPAASAQECNTAADSDCNGQVNMTELTAYVEWWYSCSSCNPDLLEVINAYYNAICIPDCAGRQCGGDGCGGSCGECGGAGFPADYVSYWKFDGSAADETGRNNGTIYGNATFVYDAAREYNSETNGYVLSLDGNGDYASFGNDETLRMSNNSFTLIVWAYDKMPDGVNTWGAIAQKSDRFMMWNDAYAGYGISRSGSNKNSFNFGVSDGITGRKTLTATGDNGWHFLALAVNRENNEMRAYVDGLQIGTAANISNVGSLGTSYNLQAGYSRYMFYKGMLDDMILYNRSLSFDEIKSVYDSQRLLYCGLIDSCSGYTDAGRCSSNPCHIGNGCDWNGNCAEPRKTWYVRPDGASYGSGDGSSYENAISGLNNLVFGYDGIGAGDTLYVCGLHVNNGGFGVNIFLSSGTAESARIIIRGDCPGDPGIVWGAKKMGANWTDEGDGVWSILLSGNINSDWIFQDIGNPTNEDYVFLGRENDTEGVRNHPGSQYSPNYATNSRLYVKLTDGGNPAGRIYATGPGYNWKMGGLRYITFLNMKFYYPSRFLWVESANHIRWENCTLSYGGHSLISLFDNSDYIEVINCELGWAASGIYLISSTNQAPSHYLFRGNYIHDMGVRPSTQGGDMHCIGIQGGHDGIIEDNICDNCGTGPLLYAFTNQELKNITVRRNIVKNIRGTPGYGISTMCNNNAVADKSGNKFYDNIVINATVGGRFQFEQEQEVYNNIFYGCNTGVATFRWSNVKLRNNIFLNSITYHLVYGSGATNYTWNSDYDLFYPIEGNLFRHVLLGGNMNFSKWQSLLKNGSIFDPHSIGSDPMFEDAANGDFTLQPDSPAIDNGTIVPGFHCPTAGQHPGEDCREWSGLAPDIGAFEYG